MNTKIFGMILLILISIGGFLLWKNNALKNMSTTAASYADATYKINNTLITLTNGFSETEAAPNSASKITTRYWGNEAVGDFNNDGAKDVAFLLTQETGGSGTFYYVVAALKTDSGYFGTNAILLGDRIAPQTTEFRNGIIIANYAERAPDEALTNSPSIGASKYLRVVNNQLVETD